MVDELTELDLFFADLHAKNPSEKAFLAALMALSREGHLCLDLDHLPFPDAAVIEGAKTASSPYVRRLGNLFYLERNYADETRILNQLKQLSFKVKPLDYASPPGLTAEQQNALTVALSNTLSIIEGGPGTGKTFLTSHLVKAIGLSAQVILAAPTGKAAARLKVFNPEATCGTLHSILGIKSQRQLARGNSYVKADLIIIDESSMIDAKLMAFFLGSLEVGQRVVFLGDGNQLPPVESGSLFTDLVDLLPTAHLSQCLRSDRIEVLQLARDVLAGTTIAPHEKLSKEFILQKAQEGFSILSPIREGPFGVNQLNQEIFQFFYHRMGQLLAVPILITRTDYEAGLYNGEVGMLWRTKEKSLYAVFGERKIAASALPPHELGYVLSVHKSQGSEFDHVLALVPPGSETFGREVLYTAVTRARQSVILCGDQETINATVGRSSQRRSGLKIRWKDQKN
ncbi:MAG TPA: AAA family ATPase [Rhabdochlamydiaceae bacterium]|jgi:exodeoxyribonuclease V alpha subunit|nr:AAA family ATPase [Rhabdochlamydiaceae bacterium]